MNGKVSDEWFMKLSHKYEVEMDETKKNILALREKLDSLAEKRQTKENFIKAVRSFMEMKTLDPVIDEISDARFLLFISKKYTEDRGKQSFLNFHKIIIKNHNLVIDNYVCE